jgi:hypothetical protein
MLKGFPSQQKEKGGITEAGPLPLLTGFLFNPSVREPKYGLYSFYFYHPYQEYVPLSTEQECIPFIWKRANLWVVDHYEEERLFGATETWNLVSN